MLTLISSREAREDYIAEQPISESHRRDLVEELEDGIAQIAKREASALKLIRQAFTWRVNPPHPLTLTAEILYAVSDEIQGGINDHGAKPDNQSWQALHDTCQDIVAADDMSRETKIAELQDQAREIFRSMICDLETRIERL